MASASAFSGQRVLIAEDEWLIANELRAELTRRGADVVGPLPTVGLALGEVVGGTPIDGAVLDINLKGELAFPIADALVTRGIPFIFATGYSTNTIPDRFRDVPRCAKPVVGTMLEEVWRRLARPASGNRLLASLSEPVHAQLQEAGEVVALQTRTLLEQPRRRLEHCYFLQTGVASVLATGQDGECIEIGMIGSEGMAGLPLVFGVDRSLNRTIMLTAGTALCVPATSLSALLNEDADFRRKLELYAFAFGQLVGQSALAAGRYTVDERLARWLLMLADRLSTTVVEVTHDQAALVLGVRRASVTLALQQLADHGLIRNKRGEVEILNRQALMEATRGCYGLPEAEFQRIAM